MRIREPGVQREHRDLHGKAQEEGQEYPELYIRRKGVLKQHRCVKGEVPCKPSVVEIEYYHPEEHEEASQEREDEELYGGIEPPRAAPDAYDKDHGYEDRLPEYVEEEEVKGHEHPERGG